MTPRDRLLAVFKSRRPEFVPFVPDLSYYFETAVSTGEMATGADRDEAHIDFCAANFAIPYYIYGYEAFMFRYEGVRVETVRESNRSTTRYYLEGWTLTDVREYSTVSHSWSPIQYAVQTGDDLRVLRDLALRTVCTDRVSHWQKADARMGDRGYVICPAPRSPLAALIVDWAGVENSAFLLADEPELFRNVLSAFDRRNNEPFEMLARCPAELVHFCDNLTGSTFAGWWDEFLAEYYRRRVAQLHAAGKYCASHLDGTLAGMISRMATTGLDAIESITPAPVGDLTIEQVEHELEGFDTIFWGGIPGAMFAKPFAWPQVRRQVDSLLSLVARGRRLIVASADQVPPDGQIEFVKMIADYLSTRSIS